MKGSGCNGGVTGRFEAAVSGVVARYRDAAPATARFVAAKLRRDPVYRQLCESAPFLGPIVDLGCGVGQTGLLLADLQPGVAVLGVDWDSRKLQRARQAARGVAGVRIARADVRRAPITRAGTVLLLDVLHYLPPTEQDGLLAAAAATVAPGGRLMLRELDAACGWRATVTCVEERVARWAGWHRGAALHYRAAAELVALLEGAGMRASVEPSWQGTPFGNVLITACR